MSDLFLDLGEDFPVESVGNLLKKFFKYHKKKKREIDRTKSPVQKAFNPLALKLNPFGTDELDEKWFAVYYRKFFVVIEQGSGIFGPHAAKLYIEVHQGNRVWLGTAQFRCNFFSRKELRKKLRLAITKEKYWCSEKLREQVVEFRPPDADEIQIKL